MNAWAKAVALAIEEQATDGTFVNGEMLIAAQDADATFSIMADNLESSPDIFQEWIINNDEAMSRILNAIIQPRRAEYHLRQIRDLLGREILKDNQDEIETIHRIKNNQAAHDAHWDMKMEEMRETE